MKLKEFGKELVFDTFPAQHLTTLNPAAYECKFFLTHMLGMAKLPPKWLPKIYTTRALAAQLIFCLNSKSLDQCTEAEHFVILKPFEPTPLRLSNGEILEVLACESDDANRNLMILLRKDKRTTHLYAGICTDVRSALLNDTFAAWIAAGVDHLYMDLNKASAVENYALRDATHTVIDQIEAILGSDLTLKIQLVVPLYGSNAMIAQLAKRLRARVTLTGPLAESFANLNDEHVKKEHFQANAKKATIIVNNLERPAEQMKYTQGIHKCLTIRLTEDPDSNKEHSCYRELLWSARPTPYELRLLAELVRPVNICGIWAQQVQVPMYLQKLCRTAITTPTPPTPPTPPNPAAKSAKASTKAAAATPKKSIQIKLPKPNKRAEKQIECGTTLHTNTSTVSDTKSKIATTPNTRAEIPHVFCRRKKQLRYLEESDSDDD